MTPDDETELAEVETEAAEPETEPVKVETKQPPSDRWRFYKDNQNCWRWKRTSKANGQCVGIAHEGYKNLADCTANAERNGFDPTRDEALTE